jgi:tetratricopeptide (TPR) repeat protein
MIYRQLGTANMQAEDLFLLGRGLIRRGQLAPGKATLGAALDVDPGHPETLETLLELSLATERPSLLDALKQAERLRQTPGWELQGSLALGQVRHRLLDPEGAAASLSEALDRDPRLSGTNVGVRDVRRLVARCLLECGRVEEARSQLSKLLSEGPDTEASWLLSRALLMLGRSAEAGVALEKSKAAADDPMRIEPAVHVGARECSRCHLREYQWEQSSRHSQTIQARQGLAALPWPEGGVSDIDHQEVAHTIMGAGDSVELSAQVGNRIFSAVLEYALGSNHHGRSFVGHDRQGQAREARLSQYPSEPVWSRTSEHPATPPDPEGYLGRPISEESVRRCVHCHSTNFRAVQYPQGRQESSDRGIGCERCHGPGGHHVEAVRVHFTDLAIARPRLATAAEVTALCGDCHRAPESASPADNNFIRFQAPTLMQSRCFTESGALSCVSCHNPHRDASRNTRDYEAVCLRCHPPQDTGEKTSDQADRPDGRAWPPCPVNSRGECLRCHMPRITDAIPRAVFTDHFIRIRASREAGSSH